ncbi:MAG: hypothetical protein AAGF11_52795 [Myxococcota bacterium]
MVTTVELPVVMLVVDAPPVIIFRGGSQAATDPTTSAALIEQTMQRTFERGSGERKGHIERRLGSRTRSHGSTTVGDADLPDPIGTP